MTSCEDMVKYYTQKDLSGQDIQHLTRKPPYLYSDLASIQGLDQLLGDEGYAVILYQTSSRSVGHWVSLYKRYDGVLCFADSYGLKYDTEQQYAGYTSKLPKYLTQIMEGSRLPIKWNKTDFQSKNTSITTCGRYASFFCLFGQHMSFQEINGFLLLNKNTWLNPDSIVTMCTLWSLGEIRHFFDRQNRYASPLRQ